MADFLGLRPPGINHCNWSVGGKMGSTRSALVDFPSSFVGDLASVSNQALYQPAAIQAHSSPFRRLRRMLLFGAVFFKPGPLPSSFLVPNRLRFRGGSHTRLATTFRRPGAFPA